jgi:restriction endonuclease S subunit
MSKNKFLQSGDPTKSLRLGDLCQQNGGFIRTGPFGSQLHSSDYVTKGIPLVMPQNIGDNEIIKNGISMISQEDADRLAKYKFYEGDIVYSRRGDVTKRAYIKKENEGWICGTGCLLIRAGKGNINTRFLAYQLGTPIIREWIQRHAIGATMPNLNTAILSDIPLSLPELEDQNRIANILGALDDKIELNRRMNHTLESMARAVFDVMFSTNENLHDSNFCVIGKIADVIDCLHSEKPERKKKGLPLLQLSNILDNGLLDISDFYLISPEDYQKWISRIEVQKGDIVITNVGRVGAVAQIPAGLNAALGRNMTAIRCKADFPYPSFLICCLLSKNFKLEIARKTDVGTILNALNVKNIPNLAIPTSSKTELIRFEKFAQPIRKKMENNLVENQLIIRIRNTFLSKLINCEEDN